MKLSAITLPLYGCIDLSEYAPLIMTPEFLRLQSVSQLGTNRRLFPGATHTRFEHSLGTCYLTRNRARRLFPNDEKMIKTLGAFGLCHDIGHGPYSHVIESLLPCSHDARKVEIITKLKPQIEQCGADFDAVFAMAKESDPKSKVVLDKNLGTDKFNYLCLDAYHSGIAAFPDTALLEPEVGFHKNDMFVGISGIELGMELQRFYCKMYYTIYIYFPNQIAASYVTKIVYLMLKSKKLQAENIQQMSDFELDYSMKFASFETKQMEQNLRDNKIPKPFINIIIKGNNARNDTPHFYLEKETLLALKKKIKDQNAVIELENKIAKIIGCLPEEILFVERIDNHRFVPQDMKVRLSSGKFTTLKKIMPKHFEALEELADTLSICSICAGEDCYKEALDKTGEIYKLLLSIATA